MNQSKYEDEGGHPINQDLAIDEAMHKQESMMDEMDYEIRRLKKINDKLITALANILTGITIGAVRIETSQDETWNNAMERAHTAIKEARGISKWLKKNQVEDIASLGQRTIEALVSLKGDKIAGLKRAVIIKDCINYLYENGDLNIKNTKKD